jgi:hypothetical protein
MAKLEDLVYVHAPGNKGLRDLLHAWTRVVLRYCELHHFDDNPWWANERASISTLAGAAWTLNGWCALEEFSTKKRGKVPTDKVEEGGLRHGRCDLYISNKRTDYVFEAKQAWQSIGDNADGYNYLYQGMQAAWKDAGCLSVNEADHRFAATFIIPHVPKTQVGKNGARVRKLVEKWLDSRDILPIGKGPLFFAYVFPSKGHGFVSDVSEKAFPGVMLVLEKRMHANKFVQAK